VESWAICIQPNKKKRNHWLTGYPVALRATGNKTGMLFQKWRKKTQASRHETSPDIITDT
jgi:hypothetical protein